MNGEYDFEEIFNDALKDAVFERCKEKLTGKAFESLSALTADTVVAQIKLKMENFLTEDIAISDGWGKPTFVGSIEDLIKKRFDDVLLRSVDGNGKTISGCTSAQKTWIEWRIESILTKGLQDHIENAKKNILNTVCRQMKDTIAEFKDKAIKDQVDSAFASMLKQAK
jgi:hypothetical protein